MHWLYHCDTICIVNKRFSRLVPLEPHMLLSALRFDQFTPNILFYFVSYLLCGSVAEWLGRWTCDQ